MKRFVFGACLFGLAWVVGLVSSCGPPSFSLDIYYSPSVENATPNGFQRPKLQQLRFFARATQDPKQAGWTRILNAGDLSIPSLPCSETPPSVSLGLVQGSLRALFPFVEMLGYESAVEPTGGLLPDAPVTGRFPLEQACRNPSTGQTGRNVAVFLSPPGSMMPWNGSNGSSLPADWSQRMGHRVTRLGDGRYLITGGAKSLALPGLGQEGKWELSWQSDLVVYQPSTGQLERQPLGIKRAFHTAIWRNNRLYLSGGLTEDSNGQVVLAERVSVLDYSPETNNWKLRDPTAEEAVDASSFPRRAFHKTLQLPVANQPGVFQHVFLGGLSVLPPDPVSQNDGLQVMFHTLTEVPAGPTGVQSVLMLGGAYRQADGSFEASQAGLGFEVNSNGTLQRLTTTPQIPAVLHNPRAGHTATALSSDLILVIGGFRGTIRGERQLTSTMEFIRRDGSTWSPVAECSTKVPNLGRRVFATATRLRERDDRVEILVAGGVGPTGQPVPSMLVVWQRKDTLALCDQLEVNVLSESYNQTMQGLHSATLLETGQVMLLGGADFTQRFPTVEALSLSAWFNPGPQYDLLAMASTTEPGGGGDGAPTETSVDGPVSDSTDGGQPEDGGSPELPEPPPPDEPKPLPPAICSSTTGGSATTTCGLVRTLRNTSHPTDPSLGSSGSVALDSSSPNSRYVVASAHTGVFQECPAPFPTSRGLRDVLVAKFNSDGSCLWAVNAGGTGDDEALSVTVDKAGSIYVTGYFTGSASFGAFTLGDPNVDTVCKNVDPRRLCSMEMFVAKLSGNGQWLWAKAVTGISSDVGRSIAVGASNDVYVTGSFSGDSERKLKLSGVANVLQHSGVVALFVARLNAATGSWEWANTADSGGSTSYGSKVVVTPDSSVVYLTGGFYGAECLFVVRPFNNSGLAKEILKNTDGSLQKEEGFVARLNEKGEFSNVHGIQGKGDTRASSLDFQPSGIRTANAVFVVGSFQGQVTLGKDSYRSNASHFDSYVFRLTGSLEPVSHSHLAAVNSKVQQGTPTVLASEITIHGDDIYVMGTFINAFSVGGANVTAGKEGAHIWLARLNSESSIDLKEVKRSGSRLDATASNEIALGFLYDPRANTPVVLGYRQGNASFGGQNCTTPTSQGALLFFWKVPDKSCSWGLSSRAEPTTLFKSARRIFSFLGRDANGNLYVVGSFGENLSFEGSQLSCKSAGAESVFAAKWDSKGSLVWLRCWGGSRSVLANGAALDPNGATLWVAGSFQGSIEATIQNGGSTSKFSERATGNQFDRDVFLAAMSTANGDVNQIHVGGSARNDEINAVAVSSNRVFVVGTFQGVPSTGSSWNVAFAPTMQDGQSNAVVGIFNKSNLKAPLRVVPVVAASRDSSQGLKAVWSPKGKQQLYVAGQFTGTLRGSSIFTWQGNQGRSAGRNDIFVVAMDETGTPSWSVTYGGSGDDAPNALSTANNGMLILGGEFEHSMAWGSRTLQSKGGKDGFVAFLASTNGQVQGLFNLGGAKDDSISALATDNTDNLYIGGTFTEALELQGFQGGTVTFPTPTKETFGTYLLRLTLKPEFKWLWTTGEAILLSTSLRGLQVDNSSLYWGGVVRETTYIPSRVYSPNPSLFDGMIYLNKMPLPQP